MTTTVAEADALIEAATEKGIIIVASPGMMLYPHNRRIRKLILEGALGRLSWIVTGVSGVGDYHMKEEFRTGEDILTDVNPAWYFKRPGGGPQYDVTVYCLHALTGIMGPAKRVTAMSGLVIPEREYHGEEIACEMDDTTLLLLDFGNSLFAFVYGTVAGSVTKGFNPTSTAHPARSSARPSAIRTCACPAITSRTSPGRTPTWPSHTSSRT